MMQTGGVTYTHCVVFKTNIYYYSRNENRTVYMESRSVNHVSEL